MTRVVLSLLVLGIGGWLGWRWFVASEMRGKALEGVSHDVGELDAPRPSRRAAAARRLGELLAEFGNIRRISEHGTIAALRKAARSDPDPAVSKAAKAALAQCRWGCIGCSCGRCE